MQVLTYILSRAVPDMRVSYAVVTDSVRRRGYFILVDPDHIGYWARFKRRYPYCAHVAQVRGARVDVACPEFSTKKELLDWLADILDLSQGERRLLYICEKT